MGIPDHLTCFLQNLYTGQEVTVRTLHGTTHWFKIGKGVCQGCILSPCLFNFYVEYIMWKAKLDESQAGIKIARRNINNLRYANNTTLMAENKEEPKEPLNEGEKGEWKSWLEIQHLNNEDHGIWPHHFMAIRRGKSGNSSRFYFTGFQNHCGWWQRKLKDACSLEENLWQT